ncbi:amidohydrolase [Clostridium rectalis]|uniref:amidohydrolase n=1 Tax=Clostridium rectalis TaxID=2040295 RepID=UPI000F62FCFE|nr:amidohydrolase [Clostridium rectalis]
MLLIKNGKIFTMEGINYEKGDILVDKGKIVKISKNINISSKISIIDAKGAWVMPGIIDAHCHIGLLEQGVGVEGNDINESTNPITPQLRAIDGINPLDDAFKDAIKAGITSVMTGPGSANVMGGQFVAIKTSGICVDEMVIKEPAAIKVAFGENPKRVYNSKGKMPTTRMATAALLRQTLTDSKNYKRRKDTAYLKGENFDINLKMESLIPVLERKIPLKAHVHRADDIFTAIRLAKEFNILITLDHCTEGDIIAKYIKNADVPAILGPGLTSKGKVETKGKSFITPYILNKEGIKFAITTDHPVVPIEYLPLCAALAVKEGLALEEALKAITINAAEIMGIDNRVGSLKEGKDADMAIFNGNPLENFTSLIYTIIDGNIVYSR